MAARALMPACALFVCSSGRAEAQRTVTFNAAPQPVQFAGYPTGLDASATHPGPEVLVYRFEYRAAGGGWTPGP